jgi:hypothetical protein
MMANMAATSEIGLVGAGRWPMILALGGPGRLDPYDQAGALIFDTAKGGLRADALTVFFATEAAALDWLADYMMDDTILELGRETGPSFEVHIEPDEEYERKALTTTETDSGWDIT